MISTLKGTIVDIGLTHTVIEVGGVGYKVSITGTTSASLQLGEQTRLLTYLAVREDALDLYGFTDERDKSLFMLLLSVSGIGPRSALSILDRGDSRRIRQAISQNDLHYLTKMAGIGTKTAQKLILELRDKIGATEETGTGQADSDALEALIVLGYSSEESREVLRTIPHTITGAQARVKEALKLLSAQH